VAMRPDQYQTGARQGKSSGAPRLVEGGGGVWREAVEAPLDSGSADQAAGFQFVAWQGLGRDRFHVYPDAQVGAEAFLHHAR